MCVEIIHDVTDSYLDNTLDPLVRIRKIWHATFLICLPMTVDTTASIVHTENQFYHNCYICVKQIITYILAIRDHYQGDSSYFLPRLLGSQIGEKTFQTVRSMSTVFSIVLNLSILGLLQWLHYSTRIANKFARCSQDS